MTKNRAIIELIFAGAFWGFGFVATIWCLDTLTPAGLLTVRFAIAFGVGELVRRFVLKSSAKFSSNELKSSLIAGGLLGVLLILQAVGLQFTTATKSGFITCLYVIEVPVLSYLIYRNGISKVTVFAVFLAIIGTFLLTGAKLEHINQGDWLTFGASLFAAIQIIYVGHKSGAITDSFRFNNFQSLACFVVTLPLLLLYGFAPDHPMSSTASALRGNGELVSSAVWYTDPKTLAGIFCLAILSSLVGFMLQIRSQKVLNDTTAALLFLLESPFSALFAFWLLNERLTVIQTLGAITILGSSALQIIAADSGKQTEQA